MSSLSDLFNSILILKISVTAYYQHFCYLPDSVSLKDASKWIIKVWVLFNSIIRRYFNFMNIKLLQITPQYHWGVFKLGYFKSTFQSTPIPDTVRIFLPVKCKQQTWWWRKLQYEKNNCKQMNYHDQITRHPAKKGFLTFIEMLLSFGDFYRCSVYDIIII